MQANIDEMRLRAALDRAVQRSYSRYLKLTERQREQFSQADELAWKSYYPWIRAAASQSAREQAFAGYRHRVQAHGDAYKNCLAIAESARLADKAKIEETLKNPDLEAKIRLLNQI